MRQTSTTISSNSPVAKKTTSVKPTRDSHREEEDNELYSFPFCLRENNSNNNNNIRTSASYHQLNRRIRPIEGEEEEEEMEKMATNNNNMSNEADSPVANYQSNNNNSANGGGSGSGNCCAGCHEPIRDKFIFSVIDLSWHQDCVQCCDCSSKLNDRCYTMDGKLYCKPDYRRRFGPKCFACSEPIDSKEFVQRIKGNRVYHLKCFTCTDCNKQLKAGEQLHLIEGGKRLLCKRDFFNQQQFAANNKSLGPNFSPVASQAQNGSSNQQQVAYCTLMSGSSRPSDSKFNGTSSKQLAKLNQENELLVSDSNEQQTVSCSSTLLTGDQLIDDADDCELDDLDLERSSSTATGDGNESSSMLLQPSGNNSSSGEQMQFAGHYVPRGGGNQKTAEAAELAAAKSNGPNSNNLIDCGDDLVDANGKRRGPRTTIKPKQLETLRQAFNSAPKPSRHIREQLATETGLNMRVIQVWFQNRRSKERRMKNSNGSARRNFFRSSSRRLRVGAAQSAAGTGSVGPNQQPSGQQQQQSLIAGGRKGAQQKQQPQRQQPQSSQLSPLEPAPDHLLRGAGSQLQGASRQQHNSPSEFGGSSSGGFTGYFSDSSNQGDAFGQQQASAAQQSGPQQQYLTTSSQDQISGASLMALKSPPGGQVPPQPQQPPNSNSNHSSNNQQPDEQQPPQNRGVGVGGGQYQSMENTPPPPAMYPGNPHPQHMLMHGGGHLMAQQPSQPPPPGAGPPPQMVGHPHPHAHLGHAGQMGAVIGQPGGMGGLLGHPQGPSVVQW